MAQDSLRPEDAAGFSDEHLNPFVVAKGNAQQLGLIPPGSMAAASTTFEPIPPVSTQSVNPQHVTVPSGVLLPSNSFSMTRSMSSPIDGLIPPMAPMAPARNSSHSVSSVKTDVALRTCQMLRTLSYTPTMPLLSENAEKNPLELLMRSVVKVFCIHTSPNFSLPWQLKRQFNTSSSGFVVSTNRRWLLTNAHSVQYHTQVKVQKQGDDTKHIAKVLAIGNECDVALLTVENDEFWENVQPVQFGGLPRLNTAVSVVGYPVGGDTVSITVGVVSRLEVKDYCFNSARLLAVQIDAAINSGNSGGPVFGPDNQCVGIAFESLVGTGIDGVGYIIPIAVVSHFLEDYKRNGRFTGFPHLGVAIQLMESAVLRRAHKMQPKQKGVLVRAINPTCPSNQLLKINDVMLSLDGVQISNDGTVPFRGAERVSYEWLPASKFVGDTVNLSVLRDGEILSITVPLVVPANLVPTHIDNKLPTYLVVGGLVFIPSCVPYLQSEFRKIPAHLEADLYTCPKKPGQQVVMLNQVLACESTLGYEDFNNEQVVSFNGVSPSNMTQLLELVAACKEPYMRFELDNDAVIVLDTKDVVQQTKLVVQQHCIPAAVSSDLKATLPHVTWPPAEPPEIKESKTPAVAGGTEGEMHDKKNGLDSEVIGLDDKESQVDTRKSDVVEQKSDMKTEESKVDDGGNDRSQGEKVESEQVDQKESQGDSKESDIVGERTNEQSVEAAGLQETVSQQQTDSPKGGEADISMSEGDISISDTSTSQIASADMDHSKIKPGSEKSEKQGLAAIGEADREAVWDDTIGERDQEAK